MYGKDFQAAEEAFYWCSGIILQQQQGLGEVQDGCEKYLNSNQLTSMTVDRSPVTEEGEGAKICIRPEESVYLQNVYYDCVYGLLLFGTARPNS